MKKYILIIITILITLIFIFLYFIFEQNKSFSGFGDFLSGLGLIFLAISVFIQKKELEQTREELKQTKEVLKQNNDESKYRFTETIRPKFKNLGVGQANPNINLFYVELRNDGESVFKIEAICDKRIIFVNTKTNKEEASLTHHQFNKKDIVSFCFKFKDQNEYNRSINEGPPNDLYIDFKYQLQDSRRTESEQKVYLINQ